jgi:hypothetical protein
MKMFGMRKNNQRHVFSWGGLTTFQLHKAINQTMTQVSVFETHN